MCNCIYCGKTADSTEHPLPAAFGEFENAPLLANRICIPCNGKLGILDEQLTRCGAESVLRKYFQIEGRSSHEKVNPHYRGSAGGGRLATKVFDNRIGCDVELELKGGREARQLCQIIFKEATGATHHLPISPDLSDPERLRADFKNLPIADLNSTTATFFCDPDELKRLRPVLTAVWPKLTFGPSYRLGAAKFDGAITEIRVTLRYFQAIAKIGFHYFLTQFPHLNGGEPIFSDIRAFITAPNGKLRLASDFMGKRRLPLLANMLDGSRPDGWAAHVLTAEMNGDSYLSHVQLFVSSEYPAPTYTVTIARGLGPVICCSSGHIYRYYEGGKRGRFAGAVLPLVTMPATMPREPLEPLFSETETV